VRFTSEQIPASARVASPAVAAVPSDTDPLAASPSDHSRADGVNRTGNLMTRDARVLNAGPKALFDQRITMADAARRHFDPDRSRRRLGDRSFNNLKRSPRARNLCYSHCCHKSSTRFGFTLIPLSRFDEGEKVGVEFVLVRIGEAVRCAGIYNQPRAFDEFGGRTTRSINRDDLIVIAVDDERGHVKLFEVFSEVRF
jgi:hypothetical protein